MQKENRNLAKPQTLQLLPDAIAIIILLEVIKQSNRNAEDLAQGLQKAGHNNDTATIQNLLENYGITKKNSEYEVIKISGDVLDDFTLNLSPKKLFSGFTGYPF